MCVRERERDLDLEQGLPLGGDVEHDALGRPRQREALAHQHQENHVGEQGGEVGHLAGTGHALPEGEEQQHVADEQTGRQDGVGQPDPVLDGGLLVEHRIPEAILHIRRYYPAPHIARLN